MAKQIGIFVGSLRKESFNRKIANNLIPLFPAGYEASIIPIDDLPLYNQDFDDENKVPESWKTFRTAVASLDAVLFVTPEYNRSVPAVLKNALDVASRPYAKNAWSGLPGAVISSSIGSISGFGANHHLRQSLVCLNVPVMAQPEVYLGSIAKSFEEDRQTLTQRTLEYLQSFLDAYIHWIDRNPKE